MTDDFKLVPGWVELAPERISRPRPCCDGMYTIVAVPEGWHHPVLKQGTVVRLPSTPRLIHMPGKEMLLARVADIPLYVEEG